MMRWKGLTLDLYNITGDVFTYSNLPATYKIESTLTIQAPY